LRLSYVSGAKEPRGFTRFVAQDILGAGEEARLRRGFAFGQSIYTPEDTQTALPLPDQHPYAGWLYGEYSVAVQRRDVIDQLTLSAGIVGPAAQGEFAQNNWHSLIGGEPANGWDNQISNQPGLMLSFDRRMRAIYELSEDGFGVDATPSAGVTLGNVQTNVRAGLMLRFGRDLRSDYGPPRVRPSLSGAGFFAPGRDFSWYLFLGAEGRAVGHDVFLDGGLFSDTDPSVDSRTLVADIQAGLALQVAGVQIGYTFVVRTEEFFGQNGAQRFGAISLSTNF
jgi:hypothetical protein